MGEIIQKYIFGFKPFYIKVYVASINKTMLIFLLNEMHYL